MDPNDVAHHAHSAVDQIRTLNDILNGGGDHASGSQESLSALLSMLFRGPFDAAPWQPHGHGGPLVETIPTSVPPVPDAHSVKDFIDAERSAASTSAVETIDFSKLTFPADNHLPGGRDITDILGGGRGADWSVPENTEFTRAEFEEVFRTLDVANRVPDAALIAALIEFFLVRPGKDIYKEDIEEDRPAVVAESFFTGGVRLGIFFLLSWMIILISDATFRPPF